MTIIPFTFTPPPRYPPVTGAWTQARIDEASVSAGPWTTIDTVTLAAEPDPTSPAAQQFSAMHATLDEGWYRVTWLDALASPSSPTPPVRNVPPTVDPDRVLAAVESFMRARLIEGGNFTTGSGTRVEHFTDGTTPTRDVAMEAATREAYAAGREYPRAGTDDQDDLVNVAAFRSAMELEGSSYPDQVESGRSPARFWRDLLNDRLKRLDKRFPPAPDADPDEPGSQSAMPLYAFPPAPPMVW